MCQNAVKCPWKKYIVLPEGAIVSSGDDCICPSTCPDYKSLKQCCRYAMFTAKKGSEPLQNLDGERYSYSADELAKQFPDYDTSNTKSNECQIAQDENLGEVKQPSNGYILPIFGGDTKNNVETNEAPFNEQNITISNSVPFLTPKRQYDSFELRGIYYTLDGRGGTKNLKDPVSLNAFYRLLLFTFDIESVFYGNELKDRFVWVLHNTLVGEKRSRAIRILQDEKIDRNTKFFLLFYEAVFFDKKLPLYWAEQYTPNLRPFYLDITDFYRKIADETDRGFYNRHAKLALLWLRMIQIDDLNNADKINEVILKIQENVAVDRSSDDILFFSPSKGKFVRLGRKEEFVERLTVSDKTLEELESTAEFLSKYDILLQSGQYRVEKRLSADDIDVTINANEVDDDIMGMLFSQDKSLTKLQYYLYLVKRYCELFRPRTIKVGSLIFDEGKYTEQTEELVFVMCAYILGDAATDAQRRAKCSEALLAKTLYKHAVLFGNSARSARSESYMDSILSAVANEQSVALIIRKFFEICRQNGIDDKIKIYSNDYSHIPSVAKMFSLRDWLCRSACGCVGISNLLSCLQSPIFAAYREVIGDAGRYSQKTEELFELYKRQEQNILELVKKL